MSVASVLTDALADFVDVRMPTSVPPPSAPIAEGRVYPPATGSHADALEALPDVALIGGKWLVERTVTVGSLTGPAMIVATTPGFTVVHVVDHGVRLRDIGIVGAGSSPYDDSVRGVEVTGGGVRLDCCRVMSVRGSGVWAEDCDDLTIRRCSISDVHYAGVMLVGVVGAEVTWCTIDDVVGSATDSYGVAVTRDAYQNGRRSEDVLVAHNRISGVAREGIDTHAGKNITIDNNRIMKCGIGIAAVPSHISGVDVMAPLDVSITNNKVLAQDASRVAGAGIMLVGAYGGVGNTVEAATGVISANTVRGYGSPDNPNSGGILTYDSRNVRIADNEVDTCAGHGVTLYHDVSSAVVSGNTIIDPWSNSTANAPSAVAARSWYATALVVGNFFGRGDKVATALRAYGVRATSHSTVWVHATSNYTSGYRVTTAGTM